MNHHPTPPVPATARRTRPSRTAYRHFHRIETRWHDNDAYGHVNNVTYYAYVDTAVNRFLIDNGLIDIARSPHIFLVAETGLTYFASAAYPDALEVGLAISRLGRSSVTYDVAVFRTGENEALAAGHSVHVLVARDSQRPVDILEKIRTALLPLVVDARNDAG